MSNYILILVWIVILGIAAMYINVKRPEVVCGEKVERYYGVGIFDICSTDYLVWI
jgi:transmembrane protein EpsG